MAFDANDLSPHEHFVMERIRAGEAADFTPMAGPGGDKPRLRAGFLRKLMLMADPSWSGRGPGVRIKGARIEGSVDLTDCSGGVDGAMPALSLEACEIPEAFDLRRARIVQLHLHDCQVWRLEAAGATFDAEVSLAGSGPFGAPGAEAFCADLAGARIGGRVCASGASFARASNADVFVLSLDSADIEGDLLIDNGLEALGSVCLAGARIAGTLRCSGAQLLNRSDDAKSAALVARGARIGGSVLWGDDTKAEGVVDFAGAAIGGDFDLAHATIRNEFGDGLLLANARIAGRLSGAPKIHGRLSLHCAEIARSIDLRGAEIANPLTPRADRFGAAADATAIAVGGAVLLQGANFKGETILADARIGGQLAFGGGRFINGGGWAIRAANAVVGGDLTLKIEDGGFAPHGPKTVIEGGALFLRARIGGALAWTHLELRGQGPEGTKGGVLSFAGAQVAGPVQARSLVTHQDALVDASGARCAALDDDAAGWGADAARLDLDGFVYDRIERPDETWRERLAWLKRASRRFSSQPYWQLARVYARAGQREDARRILLALRDRRTMQAPSGPITWLLSSLFGLIAGYGLAPIRMARALVLFIAIGVAGVFVMNGQGALVTPDGRQCRSAVEPALYAVDVALPLVDLGQASRCRPGRTARAELPAGVEVSPYSDWRIFEGVAIWRWAHALYAIVGAILAALAVLTFSGAMRPRGK